RDAAEGRLYVKLGEIHGSAAANRALATRSGGEVLTMALGRSAQDLESAYQDFVLDIVKQGNRTHIVNGKSPRQHAN
ncbi:MAG: hypothetical protein AAGB34_03555, partial [Planctomycetota bacterium]